MSYEKILIKDSSGKVVHTISAPFEEAIFGRDPKRSNIVFAPNARGVSRLHAVILWGEDSVQITDSSSHGTIVNDKKIVGESTHLESGENSLKIGESDYFVILEEKEVKKKKSADETTQITSFFAQPSRKRKPESPVVLDLESQIVRGPAKKRNVQPQKKIGKIAEVEENSEVIEIPEKSMRKFPRIQEDAENLEDIEKSPEILETTRRKFPRVSEVQETSGNSEDLEKSSRRFPRASEAQEEAEIQEKSIRKFPRAPEVQKEFPRAEIQEKSETPSRKREIPAESENPPKKSKIEEIVIKKEEISPVNNRTIKKSIASNLTFFTNLIYEKREKPEKSINNSTATGKVNFKRFKPKNGENTTTIHRPTVPIKLVDFRKLKI